jgi:alkanesulfonate monooxygenase SsuD/methylene tetrahydromethanopterin reductase-like flavin-dependent oxidoreductase (luciferase family)
MKYAITFPNAGPYGDPKSAAELAAMAEDAGWDGVFLEDYIVHHIAPGALPTYDPWISLALIAARTSKVRIGMTVTPLPRRRPWKVAREALTIDHLSGGRMILGVGNGAPKIDWSFSRFGEALDDRTRAELLDEGLQIITGLWSGERFSFAGKHYRVTDVTFVPTPLQKPRIPIWVGGAWPHKGPMRRAARFDGYSGYRVDPDGPLKPDDVRAVRAEIESHRESREPFEIIAGGWPRTDDPEKIRAGMRACEAAGVTWWAEYAFGPPDEVRAHIRSGPLRI